MAVRAAKFTDIPQMVLLLEEGYRRSIYAGKATFDVLEAKRLIATALQRHGHTNLNGSLVIVSEAAGIVDGLLIGILDNVYPCLKELVATDLLFIQSEHANPRDGILMLKNLIAWAEANPKVIEIHLGVASTVGDWERTAQLYERLGLERCGAMFRKEFDRTGSTAQEVRHVQSG
jgi:hypothetical protein